MDGPAPGTALDPFDDSPGNLNPVSDGLGAVYSAIADDASNSRKEREAAMSFALAERHLEAEDFNEAAEVATEAVSRYGELGESFKSSHTDALRLLLHCFRAQGKLEFAGKMAKEEYDGFETKEDTVGAGKMLLSIAEVSMERKGAENYMMALRSASQALEIFQEENEKRMEAIAYLTSVRIHLKSRRETNQKGYVKRAIQASRAAHSLYDELGDTRGMARALHNLAIAYHRGGRYEDAHQASKKAVALFRKLGDPQMEAYELQCMAQWQLATLKPELALPLAEEAVLLFRKCAIRLTWEAAALSTLVRAHVVRGEMRKAIQAAQSGVRRFQGTLGDKHAEVFALDALVYAYSCYNDTHGAVAAAQKALAAFQDLGERRLEATMVRTIAGLHLQSEELDKALNLSRDALQIFKELQDEKEQAHCWLQLANIRLRRRDTETALRAVNESQGLFQILNDKRGEAVSLLLAASIYFDQEDSGKAGSMAAQAHALLRDAGDKRGEAGALKTLAEIQLVRGEYERAKRAGGMAADLFHAVRDKAGEAGALLLACQALLKAIVAPDSEMGTYAFEEGRDEALDRTVRAVALGRDLDDWGILASALFMAAQVELVDSNPDDALRDAEEALVLFRGSGDPTGEANTLNVHASALAQLERYAEAHRSAKHALLIYQDSLDLEGEEQTRSLLDEIKQFYTPPDLRRRTSKKNKKKVVLESSESEDERPRVAAIVPTKAEEKKEVTEVKLAKLDTSGGITNAMLRARLREAVTEMGLEEFDDDSMLMNSGLTSGNTIMLKSVIEQDFPMMELPATLAFDYPSIGAIADYVMTMMENYKE